MYYIYHGPIIDTSMYSLDINTDPMYSTHFILNFVGFVHRSVGKAHEHFIRRPKDGGCVEVILFF
jgi:hypothetical protein